jgi:hypothetical protein
VLSDGNRFDARRCRHVPASCPRPERQKKDRTGGAGLPKQHHQVGARLRHRRVHDGGSVLRFGVVMGLSVGCSVATRARLHRASRVPSVSTVWDEDATSRSTWSREIETIL